MSSPENISAKEYIRGLDGLRAFAVMMVLFAHAGYGNYVPGGFGVTVFFTISGYLITRLLLTELAKTSNISLKNFYIRRFLRLYPELIVLVFLCLSFGPLMDFQASISEKMATIFYYMNYYFIFGLTNTGHSYPWHQLWSLAVEEHFYLFFPALLFLTRHDRRLQIMGTLTLIIAPMLWRPIAYHILHLPWQYNYVATEARIDSIAWGCLLALLMHGDHARKWSFATAPKISIPLTILCLALLVATFVVRSEDFRWTWRFSIQGFCLLILFHNLLYAPIWKFAVDFLELALLRFIGRISYALYLYHVLINTLLERYTPSLSSPAFLAASLICSTGVAALSYRLVEIPIKPLRWKMGSHSA